MKRRRNYTLDQNRGTDPNDKMNETEKSNDVTNSGKLLTTTSTTKA